MKVVILDPYLFNDFIIHHYFLQSKKFNDTEIKKEFGNTNRILFSNWNKKCLELLDENKKYPIFLIELLT